MHESMEFVASYVDMGCIFFSEVEFLYTTFRKTLLYCAVDYSISLPLSQKRGRIQTKSYDFFNIIKVSLLSDCKGSLYVSCT